MGDLENCEVCARPVLELEGQFEILQPYYAESEDPAFKLAGWVHTLCLASSSLGASWARWRTQHFSGARGYEVASEAEGWIVLQDRRRRALIAFHTDGASVAAEHGNATIMPCPGGGCMSVERDAHIAFSDREFVAGIQQELTTARSVPLSRVVDKLEIRDKLQWPAVLESGEYRFSRQLQGDWSPRSFAARVHYRKFLPEVVLSVWNTL